MAWTDNIPIYGGKAISKTLRDNFTWLKAQVDTCISKAIFTTQGDLLVRGAADPQRLAGGVAGTCLVGKGAGVKPEYADKKHKLFSAVIPVVGTIEEHGARIINGTDKCYMFMRIPDDYLRDVKIEVLYKTRATGANMHVGFDGFRMREGETGWTDTWNLPNQNVGATVSNKLYVYDITGQFSAIRPGDIISIRAHYSALAIDTDLNIFGLQAEYVST